MNNLEENTLLPLFAPTGHLVLDQVSATFPPFSIDSVFQEPKLKCNYQNHGGREVVHGDTTQQARATSHHRVYMDLVAVLKAQVAAGRRSEPAEMDLSWERETEEKEWLEEEKWITQGRVEKRAPVGLACVLEHSPDVWKQTFSVARVLMGTQDGRWFLPSVPGLIRATGCWWRGRFWPQVALNSSKYRPVGASCLCVNVLHTSLF